MDEQARPVNDERRPYRLRRRLEGVDATRRRITDAAVALYGSVGPAATTMTAVAERAGVTRATLYRHFPSDAELFAAASSHWQTLHPDPDIASWSVISDPRERLRTGLSELYAWYLETEDMTANLIRDRSSVPPASADELAGVLTQARRVLADGWPSRESAPLLRPALAHAVSFETWRSFRREGLTDEAIVELMARLVRSTAGTAETPRPAHTVRPADTGRRNEAGRRGKGDKKAKGGRKDKHDRKGKGRAGGG